MIELGTGFHPELTGQENVLLNTSIHGLSRAEALAIYDRSCLSGLRHFMDVPIKNYSSGMHMRLGFRSRRTSIRTSSCWTKSSPSGTRSSSASAWARCGIVSRGRKTILFVSHSAAAVQAICRRVCVLERGQLRFDGDVDAGLTEDRRLNQASPHQPVGRGMRQ